MTLRAVAGGSGTGGGTPGGSTLQVQYNLAGAFAGMSGTSWDDTNRALTITGATVTTSKPTFSVVQTWNAGAVTFFGDVQNITDTASATASQFVDYQIAGVSKYGVRKDGAFGLIGTAVWKYQSAGAFGNNDNFAYIRTTETVPRALVGTNGFGTTSQNGYGWSGSSGDATTVDTAFMRNSAKIPEVNSGTAGSYTGTALLLGLQTVAQLPAVATALKGARATVSDAIQTMTSANYGVTVTGGGANVLPVFCNGTNWVIG